MTFAPDLSDLAKAQVEQAIKGAQQVRLAVGGGDHITHHTVRISKSEARRLLKQSPHWSVAHMTSSRVVELTAIRAEKHVPMPRYLSIGV